MKKKGIPILIVLLLIFVIGVAGVISMYVRKHTPTKKEMDKTEYYGETSKDEFPLVFETEILESRGLLRDGVPYLPLNVVNTYLNPKFYWAADEKEIFYAHPKEIEKIPANDDSGKVIIENKTVYLSLDFVKEYTDMSAKMYETPQRMVVNYKYDHQIVKAKEEESVRYRGGIKSEILTTVQPGDKMWLMEEYENWDQVATTDGYVGFIPKTAVGEPEDSTKEVQYTLEDYTSIQSEETINLAWHQVTSQDANGTLDATLANVSGVNVISPTWFSITDNQGNVSSIASKEYVAKAHQRKMEVWGLIDNFSENVDTEVVLSSSTARTKIIKKLMAAAKKTGLDGINVDFETMTEDTIPHFLEFLRELSISCRTRGLILSVDNPPPQDYTKYYNRREQASVVDYIVVMGYDEHYSGSEEAGSVASLPWVIQGLEDTLQEVPAEKVIHGIPFYTRLWRTSAGIVTSEAISMSQAAEVVQVHKVETYWNKKVHQNYGKYEEGNDVYEIWLEDADSIAEKVKLVPKYGLAGVAEWKLGFEDSSIWSVISENLKDSGK
ncbi:MAG: glycosyl hydrolase family 18 protein [Blautia sp.]